MKKLLVSLFVLAVVLGATNGSAVAQTETAAGVNIDTDILLLRRDLRSDKKKLIALNLPLTETEATKFWPVYDQYAAEMAKVNDEFYALIKDYAQKQKTILNGRIFLFVEEKYTDLEYRSISRSLRSWRLEQSLENEELRHESQLVAVEPFSQRLGPIEVGPG